MASAIDRLRAKVELARVVVPPYPRVNERGSVEHVDGYTYDRAGAKVSITPVGSKGRPKIAVPDTSLGAARLEAQRLHEREAAKLARLEGMSDEEFKAFSRSKSDIPKDLFVRYGDLHHEPINTALWRERHHWGSKPFKETSPGDWERLGVARGDARAMQTVTRRFAKKWRRAEVEKTTSEQRRIAEDAFTQAFSEQKMRKIVQRFGLPVVVMAFNTRDGGVDTNVADMDGLGVMTIYDSTSLVGTPDERLEPGLVPMSNVSKPGLAVTSSTEASGTAARGASAVGVMRHEYGHFVASELSGGIEASPPGWRKRWDAMRDEYDHQLMVERVATREQQISEWHALQKRRYAQGLMTEEEYKATLTEKDPWISGGAVSSVSDRKLSYYALENYREGWAEVFAIVTHPDFDRSEWKGVIGEDLLDWAVEVLGL